MIPASNIRKNIPLITLSLEFLEADLTILAYAELNLVIDEASIFMKLSSTV